jgi:hypothetical protein
MTSRPAHRLNPCTACHFSLTLATLCSECLISRKRQRLIRTVIVALLRSFCR